MDPGPGSIFEVDDNVDWGTNTVANVSDINLGGADQNHPRSGFQTVLEQGAGTAISQCESPRTLPSYFCGRTLLGSDGYSSLQIQGQVRRLFCIRRGDEFPPEGNKRSQTGSSR